MHNAQERFLVDFTAEQKLEEGLGTGSGLLFFFLLGKH